MAEGQEVETVQDDIGTKGPDIVERWLREIKLAESALKYRAGKKWEERAKEIVAQYRDEEAGRAKKKFNILYSNTETLKPALYGQVPNPDVRRKHTDSRIPDGTGREAAIVMEKTLKVAADDPETDFDDVMSQCVEDYVLPGRGQARVRYVPVLGEPEPERVFLEREERVSPDGLGMVETFVGEVDGERRDFSQAQVQFDENDLPYALGENTYQPVLWEEIRTEYVFWQHFLHNPAKNWKGVRWVAFKDFLTKDELVEQFGEVAKDVPLDWSPDQTKTKDFPAEQADFFKKATVWEIWDRVSRKVYVIAMAFKERPLAIWDDPLGLQGFFPCPRPMIFGKTTDSMTPVPFYAVYQDQANELNKVSRRIDNLVNAISASGVYAGSSSDLIKEIVDGSKGNRLVPLTDWAKFQQSGGLRGLIDWLPVEQYANALQVLITQRLQLKQTIFEITGISDIMRGQTDPGETKGAQVLKTQFGNLRIQNPRKEVERFARDLFRLMAEIVAEKFGLETIQAMSGEQLPTAEEKQQAAQLLQQAQQQAAQAQQAPPEVQQQIASLQEIVKRPTWDEVMSLYRDEGTRGFRIQVESDTTVMPDAFEEQKNRTEFLTAITQFIQAVAPGIQTGMFPVKLAKAMLAFGVRGFKVGREIEQALDELDAIAAQGPAQQETEGMTDEELALETFKAKSTSERDRAKIALDAQIKMREQARKDKELELKAREIDLKAQEVDTKRAEFIGSESGEAMRGLVLALQQTALALQQATEQLAELDRARSAKVINIVRDDNGRIVRGEVA